MMLRQLGAPCNATTSPNATVSDKSLIYGMQTIES
jgi:hypothetical protein